MEHKYKKKIVCYCCGNTFYDKSSLNRHIARKYKRKNHTYRFINKKGILSKRKHEILCPKNIANSNKIKNKRISKAKFTRKYCGKKFTQVKFSNNHTENHHKSQYDNESNLTFNKDYFNEEENLSSNALRESDIELDEDNDNCLMAKRINKNNDTLEQNSRKKERLLNYKSCNHLENDSINEYTIIFKDNNNENEKRINSEKDERINGNYYNNKIFIDNNNGSYIENFLEIKSE